jgi:hypothetical protein
MLADGFAFPAAFDDLDIGVVADLLDPNEHGAPPCTTFYHLIVHLATF